jgi:hypothetical protein
MAGENLHKEKLQGLYSSLNTVRVVTKSRTQWAGNVVCMEEKRHACRILVGKSEDKRLL